MSVLVMLAKSPVKLERLGNQLSTDLGVPVVVHDVLPFGWLEAGVNEGQLFDAAGLYLSNGFYTTGSYPDELS